MGQSYSIIRCSVTDHRFGSNVNCYYDLLLDHISNSSSHFRIVLVDDCSLLRHREFNDKPNIAQPNYRLELCVHHDSCLQRYPLRNHEPSDLWSKGLSKWQSESRLGRYQSTLQHSDSVNIRCSKHIACLDSLLAFKLSYGRVRISKLLADHSST